MRHAIAWPGKLSNECHQEVLIMRELLLAALALSIVVATPTISENSVLRSLPTDVQKDIEETRAACQQNVDGLVAQYRSPEWSSPELSRTFSITRVPPLHDALVTFTIGDKQAVLVDPILLCGECYPGTNCSNRGTRDVRVYARLRNAWRKIPFLEPYAITGDIFVSYVPGYNKSEVQELNALVVNLFYGNKNCPTRFAGSTSEQFWEKRSCVVRWNGTKFTYKPL
jgi:hypothetical protein